MTIWLSPEEAARRTPFKREAIIRACKRGELEASKRCGRWLIAEDALERWVAGGRVAVDAPSPAAPVRQPALAAGSSFRQRARRGPA